MGLPFISYGGSNLVLLSFMVGHLLIFLNENPKEAPQFEQRINYRVQK
jgi:cell division protein FtsW (lipid II flippase)